MSSSVRFVRIAHDLEKLPCELHDAVLKDLEFAQLVRLSQTAGERLSWSLENSLAPWGLYFRNGNISRLRSLLSITDTVKKYCFKPPKSKETTGFCFERRWPPVQLRFLQYRGSDWTRPDDYAGYSRYLDADQISANRVALSDGASLFNHWLVSLNDIVIDTTWQAFHTDYHRLVEPWIASVDGAAMIFARIPQVGQAAVRHQSDTCLSSNRRHALSMEELEDFVTCYQRLRQVRTETLATELLSLADIYEAHPTRLKQPFAPQTRRLNEKHIPTGMRGEARKMTRRVAHTWWKDKEIYKYRFAFPFPGLVPYDWALRFYDQVVQRHAILPSHKDILEDAKIVQEGVPTWALNARSLVTLTEEVERWSPKRTRQTSNTSRTTWEHTYRTHTAEDLLWLQKFGDIVVRMEKEFPHVLDEIRGPGWVVGVL